MPPAKGQHPAVARLLQGAAERGEGNAEANHQVAIHYRRHQVQVGYLDVVIHQLVDLLLRQLAEAIQVLVGGIQQAEHLAAIAPVD